MKVLAIGGTGFHGGMVLDELVSRGVTVRALARNEERAQLARTRGANEVVIGDLRDETSLRAAVQGVDGVFHLGPAFVPDEAQMGLSMVRAARDAGVRKFVFSGVIHPSITALTNHAAAKLPVEEALCESGMEFTILQPARFMQNLRWSLNDILTASKITVPYSVKSKMCWVDYRDVAEAAARALTGDELAFGTFNSVAPGHRTVIRPPNSLAHYWIGLSLPNKSQAMPTHHESSTGPCARACYVCWPITTNLVWPEATDWF